MPPGVTVLLLAVALLCSGVAAAGCAPGIAVVSQGAARLTVLAPDRQAPCATIPLAAAPAGVAIAADGRTAYVGHPDLGRISLVDLSAGRVVTEIATGGQPFGLALVPDGRLLVSDWSGDTLLLLDVAGDRPSQRIPVGRAPSAVLVDAARGRAYSIDRDSDAVSVVDLATPARIATIAVGQAPFAAALSADGTQLFVANIRSGDLSVVDLAAGREVARIPVGGMPYGVAVVPGTGEVLVTDQERGRLVRVDGALRTVAGSIRVGRYPEGVAVLPDGGQAVVANWFSDTVTLVDLRTRATTELPMPAGPRQIATVPAGMLP